MDHKQRHKRLRLVVSRLNKERKAQAKKVDILCNDFIEAQKDFIKRLNNISFKADFYESIIGTSDLNGLLYTAAELIKNDIPEANVAFFLRQAESFELHMFESWQPITFEKQNLENCLSSEVVDNICKSNKLCTLDDMFAMGLEANLVRLNKTSAMTIPLSQSGVSVGFILIYGSFQNKLTTEELQHICTITPGLSRAIQSCQVPLH